MRLKTIMKASILKIISIFALFGCTNMEPEERIIYKAMRDTYYSIRYVSDEVQYGKDICYWAPHNNKGDCEDYTITLYYLLRSKKISASRIKIPYCVYPDGIGHTLLNVEPWGYFDPTMGIYSKSLPKSCKYIKDITTYLILTCKRSFIK